jgi:enterochelin esterase-like enzyme
MRKLFSSVVFICLALGWASAQSRVDCGALPSEILHRELRYCVMLPPDYDTDAKKKYPVLYFLHGLGENEQALVTSGGWELIEDLERQRKVGGFLMVAPEGRSSFFINSADGRSRYSDFLRTEFLPFVETHYRVLRTRGSRGVTGLSMGGYGALRLAFAYPQLFGSVSAQSPALVTESPRLLDADLHDGGPLEHLLASVFGDPVDIAHWNQNNPLQLARNKPAQIRGQKIYFNCGEQDEYGFAEGAKALDKELSGERVPHEFHLYPGGHDASYFLSHLAETIEFHWHAFTGGR